MPYNTSATLSVGQGNVTFDRNFWQISNQGKATGYAINLSLDKEWMISKRWSVGIGTHGFLFKTRKIEYEFMQFGINGGFTYYLKPVR
jgi:3-methyladenine DNA glycosylase Tag